MDKSSVSFKWHFNLLDDDDDDDEKSLCWPQLRVLISVQVLSCGGA